MASGSNVGGVLLPGAISSLQRGGHRPHSAPPAVIVHQLAGDGQLASPMGTSNDVVDYNVRTSLEYYQYYHSQKPLDPRLPPPLYNWGAHIDSHADGLGPSKNMKHLPLEEEDEEDFNDPSLADELQQSYAGIAASMLQGDDEFPATESEGQGAGGNKSQAEWDISVGVKKSVIARIQEDFPRTPSPIYGLTSAAVPAAAKPAHSKALPSPVRKQHQQQHGSESGSPPKGMGFSNPHAQAMQAFVTASMSQVDKQQGVLLQQLSQGGMSIPAGMDMGMQHALQSGMGGQFLQGGGMYGPGLVDEGVYDEFDGLSFQMQQLQLQQLQQLQLQQQHELQGMMAGYQQGGMMQGLGSMNGSGLPLHAALNMVGGMNTSQGRDSMEQQWLLQQQQQQQRGLQAMAMGGEGGGMMHNMSAMQQLGMNPAMLSQMQSMYRQGMQLHDRGQGNALQNLALGDNARVSSRQGLQGGGSERGRDNKGDRARATHPSAMVDVKRSVLLEEFRTSKLRKFELRDIIDHCDEFCRDQHGSRFIQTKLEVAPASEKEMVFEALLPTALSLMSDLFGNYVVQKFFERGTQEQRLALAKSMRGRVLMLSLDMYGCRVVQKAIEVVEGEDQAHLVSELQGQVMKCVRDQNGNHVIQKCIERSPPATIQFIIDDFVGQVVPLATHPYGCRVIQRILENCAHAQVFALMNEIVLNTRDLVHDQYGNYVVQHVLEHGQPADRANILMRVQGDLVTMSQHKFASNVVEKLLQFSSVDTRPIILGEFTGESGGQPAILVMMRDAYGNYVIQKALDVCLGADRERLISCIREHLAAVRKFVYGKHIIAHIEKLENIKMDSRDNRNGRYNNNNSNNSNSMNAYSERGGGDMGQGFHAHGASYLTPHVQ